MTTTNLHEKFIHALENAVYNYNAYRNVSCTEDITVASKINLLHHVLADFEEYYGSPADPETWDDTNAIYEAIMLHLEK